ncbi:nuclear transport factor 2 family protein [Actinoplanes sp. NPDC051494]|uniref:nuclear transport factor 2 family protein n=1 Tax=Actinoplanes sp. NPDC051494 TaxID=3363907 RepID=UPI0037A0CB44
MTTEHDRLIELAHRNLLGVFGERDPQARAKTVDEIYAERVTFSDPEGVLVGREALGQKAQKLLDDAPAFVFSPVGEAQVAQDLVLLRWQLGPAGQPPVVTGTDIMIVADGRIAQLYTLLNKPTGKE